MIKWRDLPPLSALRAFAAFAEAGSVAKAGAAIGVTHAAISQQIRGLEAHLGLALVSRKSRDLALTAEGRQLADAALTGFAEMARMTRSLTGADAARALQITTTPAFAGGWLMPRLADFRAQHPGIDIVIDPTPSLRRVGPEGVDIAIRYGGGNWPGLEAHPLIQSSVVVVAAPGLIGPVTDIAELVDLPWLQELGTTETTAFFEKHGLERNALIGLTSMPGNLMLEAARAGQGVAVFARAFVENDLVAGRLQLLFEDDEREGYFAVIYPGRLRAPTKAFVAWLQRQAAQS
ncbi:MAG: LysR family glycine cleavage system transcriptional activator [Pseudorhodobacter sp.]|jgi:LysR family glycine cleavage system transcriptional activator